LSAPPIRLPAGVRDFLPRAAARRLALAERVLGVFEAWGYARLVTPVFEVADVLARSSGGLEGAIRFVEPGSGEIVALRPDITPQIARIAATRLADVEGPVRLCYEGAVHRIADRAQREIAQAGIELIDAPAPDGDAEVLAVAAAALAATGLPETHLDVGHVAPAQHVLAAAPDAEARARLAAALARKDRGGVRAAARVLPADVQVLAEELPSLWGPAETILARARALPWPSDVQAGLAQLRDVLARFAELADGAPKVTVDLGELRGEGYYTGVRFAGYAGGAPDAVLRGGRYDDLIGRYGRAARATGFAIDLESLATAQRTAGLAAPARAIGVAVVGDAALARALRAKGFRVVTCAAEPTASWLRGAGLDAAIGAGLLLRADGARAPIGDDLFRALELLREQPCPS
jgi:ATP phosphoribosyltransferase regulatory subunit